MKNSARLSESTQDTQAAADGQPSRDSGRLAARSGAVAIVIALTLFSGIVHGVLDGRWTKDEDLKLIGNRLDNLPDQAGDWKLTETSELAPGAEQLLRCYGSTVRTYENEKTGVSVNVAIMFGPRGPIAVHTPEVCYSSVGTNQVGERRAETWIGTKDDSGSRSRKDSLWSVRFAVDPLPDPSLEVMYGWSDGGDWDAREQPRFWLTDRLYKIQAAGPAGDAGVSPVKDFLDNFLPETHQVIGDF